MKSLDLGNFSDQLLLEVHSPQIVGLLYKTLITLHLQPISLILNGNIIKKIINFSIVPNHKGETIGQQIEEILREWGIRQVSTITIDNATSNDVAVAYLKKRLSSFNALILTGEYFHMRCCAYILNLIVNDGLREMQSSIVSIRTAVKFVKSSPQRLTKFRECISHAQLTSQKLVCLDVPTRWNNTYHMLEAAENFQPAFGKLDFEKPNYREFFGSIPTPCNSDWEKAKVFIRFLKIFYDATNIFSSSTNVTIHTAFHQLAEICCELNDASMNLNTILDTIAVDMKKKFDKYWGYIIHTNQLLYFGLILDPRYKLKYVEWSFSGMHCNDTNYAYELSFAVTSNLSKLYEWYASSVGQGSRDSQNTHSSQSATISENVTNAARTLAFKQHLMEKISIEQSNELERYLAENCVDVYDNFNILVLWNQNSSRYPILSSMARDLFATPVSTVAFESAFSTGGRVLDQFKSSLSPQMSEALICSQSWLNPSQDPFKDCNFLEDLEISENVLKDMPTSGRSLAGLAIQGASSQPN